MRTGWLGSALPICLVLAAPAAAQERNKVTGQNLARVTLAAGEFVKTGEHDWIMLDADGRQQFELKEEARNSRAVLLRDRGRRIDVQLDVFRMKVAEGRIAGTLRDVYSIREVFAEAQVPAVRPRAAAPVVAAAPVEDLLEIGNGPIGDRADAEARCRMLADRVGGSWTGQWRTVERNRLSLCTIRIAP
jgi:hypothetical protein